MLKLYIGNIRESISSGNGWFDNQIDQEVLLTDFSKKVIKEIDKSEVVGKNLIVSNILGPIPPRSLSGGVKSLMILMYSDYIVKLSAMGDNCFKYLSEIAEVKDIVMCTSSSRLLYNNGFKGKIFILNDGSYVCNDTEFMDKYADLKLVNDIEVSIEDLESRGVV